MPDHYAILIFLISIILFIYSILADEFAATMLKSSISIITMVLVYYENKKISVAIGIIILLVYWFNAKNKKDK